MNPKLSIQLSILICTIPGREQFLNRLMRHLYSIRKTSPIEILFDEHPTDSIGTKRNRLLQRASGDYITFIDDDDMVIEDYLKHVMAGIKKGVDCCSLRGIITEDGQNPLVFEHSIKYKEYKTNTPEFQVRYERYPNHLNCIKASIAKQFKFPEINHGEDAYWATQIFKSGLIKTEHYIPEVIYFYEYRSNK